MVPFWEVGFLLSLKPLSRWFQKSRWSVKAKFLCPTTVNGETGPSVLGNYLRIGGIALQSLLDIERN